MKTRLCVLVVAMVGCVMFSRRLAQAEEFAITSFGSKGQLTFNGVSNATNYRIEWASSVEGSWTNFATASSMLDIIPPPLDGTGRVTVLVPMFYRVVAETNVDYLVVDLSAGPAASNYPVSYLSTVPDGGWTDEYKTTNMVFRRIPAGTFTMGSPTNELGREYAFGDETHHPVTLTQPFYIGVFEVTQKQWERVMGTWPSYFTNASYRDSRPVEQVSFAMIRGTSAGTNWPANSDVDTDSFMGTLRARTGKAFDLPTESQWEYAGRAGTTTALNSGKNLTDVNQCPNMAEVGRYGDNGGSSNEKSVDTSGGTAKAGSYWSNAWGLYDIHGNVYEWCLDWLPGSEGSDRVFRGGGWGSYATYCRVAFRNHFDPDFAFYRGVGFRAALPSGQ